MYMHVARLLLSATIVLSGCYKWIAIKPSELPKVGNMQVGVVASGEHRGKAVAVSVSTVEGADGRLLRLRGEPDVRVEMDDTTTHTFKNPIKASLDQDSITIWSANRAKTKLRLVDIESVKVCQPNPTATILWAVFGTLAGSALILGLAFGIAHRPR